MIRAVIIVMLLTSVAVAATAPQLADVLEPNIPAGLSDTNKINASQAISLKRIADALDRLAATKPLTCNPIMQCSTQPPKP